ncbi:MAG: nickel pincer cofactor biosynthesis protein LarC [Methanobacteriota archaeon]
MKLLYFDCFSGIAGDMVLGALIDVGVDAKFLLKELKKLPVSGYRIEIKKVTENHIKATDVNILVTKEHDHRHLQDIINLIKSSRLSTKVKKDSIRIFYHLAQAEATVHGIPISKVHFHEVGAVDSILDIVGSVIGIHALAVDRIYCSPLPLGHGFVTCAHGVLPLPAPATVELLKDIPVYSVERNQELVTPTGAAIITMFASHFGEMPLMKVRAIGYGSGKIHSEYPSLLRVFLGEPQQRKKRKNIVSK